MVNKMNGESADLTAQNIARLKELFPEILTDSEKIDFDILKTVLGGEIDSENERYQFTWHGKKKMIAGTQKSSKGTLRPDKEKSKNFDTTENLYIEGDNLEVLKLLQKSYNNKIKMIYIDPPYNTGGDFVYKDDFKDGVQNYLEQTGQVDSEGNIFSTNSESNGRFHSDWLNMIYARLKLAKNLLADDGVIFISLDDNEITNLTKICDEIFGEKNFMGSFIWKNRQNVDSRNKTGLSTDHEYILVFCKKREGFKLKGKEIDKTKYSNPDNDPRGPWMSNNILGLANSLQRPNLHYVVKDPLTNRTFNCPEDSGWRFSRETMQQKINEGRIIFPKNDDGRPREKKFLLELESTFTGVSSILSEEVGFTLNGSRELRSLMGGKYFDFPKPVSLIKFILNQVESKDAIILDFFSGSATTAHATMQLNAEDGGKRKFIMVQLPELLDEKSEAYKDGYRTICDIGEERIRRAGEKIKAELLEKQQKSGMLDENVVDTESLDIGFKVLKLDTSNIREWNVDFNNIEDALDLYDTPFVENRSELAVVYEIMLKQGLELTYPIETFEVNGQTVYDIAFGSLFVCLSKKITADIAQAIIARRDEQGTDTSSVIFSDAGFATDSDKLNCIEILKDAGYPEDNLLTL